MNKLQKQFKFCNKKPNLPANDKIKMGWFTPNNQVLLKKYLINRCSKKSVIIEFGTWLGMSAKFICRNTTNDSKVICVDFWKGDTSIGQRTDDDELYKRFIDNTWEFRNKIIPVRMDGKKAATYLSKLGIKPDLIYLDMGHSYEEVIKDLNVIVPAFPKTIIVGDDYLFWPGVKKAVLETRHKYNIPYLNVDKNCYALLYKKDLKYMTYNNYLIGQNINKYKNEEIQYSSLPKYNKNIRIFIIPINKETEISKYKTVIKQDKKDMFIIVNSENSDFSKYNQGYKWFLKNEKNPNRHDISFIFIDPSQILANKYYKTCDGLLSITKSMNNNREPFSSLGNLSIDKKTMKVIDEFPNHEHNKFVNRYILYNKIIKKKLIIYQSFAKKDICSLELGFSKDKKMMNELNTIRNLIKQYYIKMDKQEDLTIKPVKIRKSKRVYYLQFRKN